MNDRPSVLVVLTDHDRRVRIRKMIESNFDVTVLSVANPVEGLSLLTKVPTPSFILLSSNGLPLMSYQEFLHHLKTDPRTATIPVILNSLNPVVPLPEDVVEEVKAPVSMDDLTRLIHKYCSKREDKWPPPEQQKS